MLRPFSLGKKSSKAETALRKAEMFLRSKLYGQATVELDTAFDIDEKTTVARLKVLFGENLKSGKLEVCLCVGLMLVKVCPGDFELCNQVGNTARKLQKYRQANNLYRKALKGNRGFIKAFHNLAASIGKIDKYDEEVEKAIDQFTPMKEFVWPEYRNGQTVVDNLTRQWEDHGKSAGEKKSALREKIFAHLHKAMKENWKNNSISEGTEILQGDIFNLALYALIQNDREMANRNLAKLKRQKCKFPYIGMLQAIAKDMEGNTREAIEDMMCELEKNRYDRYLNVNLGLLYRKVGNRLLSVKHFVITASLLEKSEGKYSSKEIIQKADRYFKEGNIKSAFALYELLALETEDLNAKAKIGEIHMLNHDFVGALQVFKEVVEKNPNFASVREKLQEIHDYYYETAEKLLLENKAAQAIVLLDRALTIQRETRTLEKAAKVYSRLKDTTKAMALMKEVKEIRDRELKIKRERERKEYMSKGKAYLKSKNFANAIENFEKAFCIRRDKETFQYLAHIYKGLKRTNALNNLTYTWRQWLEFQKRNEAVPEHSTHPRQP